MSLSLVWDSAWTLVQRTRVSGLFCKSKMLQFTTASRTDLISFSLQTLDTCFICLEDEFNMRKTLCCGQTAHMRCIRNWIRTLIPSSVRCPGCREDYAFPLTPEEEENLHSFMVECSQVRSTFSIHGMHAIKQIRQFKIKYFLPVSYKQKFTTSNDPR